MGGGKLRIGTRRSALALEQASRVQALLKLPSEIVQIHTSGDRLPDCPLGDQNPVGFFTKEIENALIEGNIDIAVHSLKDLPTASNPRLSAGVVLPRDDPEDMILVAPQALDPSRAIPVKPGSRVGASSRRRQALLGLYAPDLVPAPIRGNVPTRIEKLVRGDYDAIVLSRAGLQRLRIDVAGVVALELNLRVWPCAPGQAVIAVQRHSEDQSVAGVISPLNHEPTARTTQAERSLLAMFGGGCHAPFGAFAEELESGEAQLMVCAPDSSGTLSVRAFSGANLSLATVKARDWISSGCAGLAGLPLPPEEIQVWITRRARSWC